MFKHLTIAAMLCAAPASAANVTLSANLTSSCTLTLSSGGTMTMAAGGTILSSENAGGSAASLDLVAVGTNPTVTFAAPDLAASPVGWGGRRRWRSSTARPAAPARPTPPPSRATPRTG